MTARPFLWAAAAAMALAASGWSAPAGHGGPSPDLVFVSSRGGDYALYGLWPDGTEARLTPRERRDGSSPQRLFFQVEPAWSPDGRLIAFSSMRYGSFDIFVMRADGSGTRRLTRTQEHDSRPSWSPDGSRIVFDRGQWGDLYVMNADGSGAHRITHDPAQETDPAWSPDGRWIAYVRRERGTRIHEIWLIRPDGSQPHPLTRLGAGSYSPAWSPDGSRIVFASNTRDRTWGIYVVSADGKTMRRLVRPAGDGSFEPAWSADGTRLAFARGGAIVVQDSAGREVARSLGGNDSSPAWRPGRGRRP